MRCPSCHASIPDSSRFCPSCGAALEVSSGDTRLADDRTRIADDRTRLADDQTRLAPPTPTSGGRSGSTTSGWLSSSGSIDHGRFAPGAVLDNRYRIIGLLGRGGMGEVYRADDLRLGQPVALKFLPADLSSNARRLAQFHNEVRVARQVSHPNVCRVYDIGEVDGALYLSMEYVDGEDLAASLKRVGRFPEDRAIELARQIAAGLAAAHERGVIHRDLKPANVMLDSSGRVRIMDFGLAAIGDVGDIRVGTPAYMAPEQLEGREVTIKSDIYALGLVLYELFTGRRAFTAGTLADLIQEQQSGSITAPTEIVRNFDPAIERAVMRCLDRDPAKRPASALAVSAALPGGDPLAAALAAGETPSPEMVAAAGGEEVVLSRPIGFTYLAVIAVLLAIALQVSGGAMLSRVPLDKPPEVLADRAEQIRESFGYTETIADRAVDYDYSGGYLNWAKRQGAGASRWTVLSGARPAPIYFWRRTSPQQLIPLDDTSRPERGNPPMGLTGMTLVDIDTTGRLLRFMAVPPQVERNDEPAAPPVDWNVAFSAAGLDQKTFREVASERTPDTFADDRRAWEGTYPGTDTKLRIEAASYRGRIVSFAMVGPWSVPTRDVGPGVSGNDTPTVQVFVILALLIVAAWLARRNVQSGRADRHGSFRLAAFTFFLLMAQWAVAPHVSNVSSEWRRFLLGGIAVALLLAAVLYVVYLALEPFVRRSWPTLLVGWTRLLSGRFRDPIVGRDLLAGGAFGILFGVYDLIRPLLSVWAGRPEPIPYQAQLNTLLGLRATTETLLSCVNSGLQNGLIFALQFALVRDVLMRFTRRLGPKRASDVSTSLAIVIVTFVNMLSGGGDWWLERSLTTIVTALTLLVLLRIGLFATIVMFVVTAVIQRMPFTLDATKFFANAGWFGAALLLGLAVFGFWTARQQASAPGRIAVKA
jgi:serine/threonine-protein kinase